MDNILYLFLHIEVPVDRLVNGTLNTRLLITQRVLIQ